MSRGFKNLSEIQNLKFKIKNSVWLAVFLLASQTAFADQDQLSLGGEFDGWSTNYISTVGGSELWFPLSLNFKLDPGMSLYGETEFGNGNYTYGAQTTNLTNFSDTVIGTELHFKSFGLPALLNVGFNLPTGDPTWETKQIPANIPAEFVDSRYRGRGFGVDALYALAFPSGSAEWGMGMGYMYGGAFNPSYGGSPVTQLTLGDSLFFTLNHVQPFADNQSEIIRFSVYDTMPSQSGSQDIYQLGLNLNASYSWVNPSAFSFDLGVQYWFAGQMEDANNPASLVPETNAYYGPRFYFDPSYSFGDLNLAVNLKYVLPNGYSLGNASYDGGGLLAGLTPSLPLRLDPSSDLRISAAYDYIAWLNAAQDINGKATNVIYNLWTFGMTYEVKL